MSLQPTEAELLREVIESRLADVHTSIPGRIVSYDASTQTADVEIVVRRAERAESGAVVHEDYPVIQSVPVGWPHGGGYSLQFPLEAGDGVWLVFSEAATAQWRATGERSNPGDLDRHDISYPIALPCARHDGQPLPPGADALLTVPSGGSLSISTDGGAPEAIPRDDHLQAELQRIQSDLSTLKSAISAGFTAVGEGGAASGNAANTAFQGASGAVPSTPGNTASDTLRAE